MARPGIDNSTRTGIFMWSKTLQVLMRSDRPGGSARKVTDLSYIR